MQKSKIIESTLTESGLRLIKNITIIAGLILLSFIPNCSISHLLADRVEYQRAAIDSVISGWASEQVFGEAELKLLVLEKDTWDEKTKKYTYKEAVSTHTPTKRDLKVHTQHEYRQRGIFSIPILTTTSDMIFTFDVKKMLQDIELSGQKLSSSKFIDLQIRHSKPNTMTVFSIEQDGAKLESKRNSNGLWVKLDPKCLQKDKITLHVHFVSKAYQEVALQVPGGENTIAMTSSWPHPSFHGQLPQEYTVNSKGFSAHWTLFEPSPEQLLTVRFIEPVNNYSLSERTLKYAVLIISLSLALFFLCEILFRLKLHGMHYLLLSLPLSVFFILLIALSEHLRFYYSYAIASTVTTLLLVSYLVGIGAKKKLATIFGAYLTMIYGIIFTLLNSEDYALLLGAVSLFLALATFMLLTRKVNWRTLTVENDQHLYQN